MWARGEQTGGSHRAVSMTAVHDRSSTDSTTEFDVNRWRGRAGRIRCPGHQRGRCGQYRPLRTMHQEWGPQMSAGRHRQRPLARWASTAYRGGRCRRWWRRHRDVRPDHEGFGGRRHVHAPPWVLRHPGPPDPKATALSRSAPVKIQILAIHVSLPRSRWARTPTEASRCHHRDSQPDRLVQERPHARQMGAWFILGHVDSYQGVGFDYLKDLIQGDQIRVTLADGTGRDFVVDGQEGHQDRLPHQQRLRQGILPGRA